MVSWVSEVTVSDEVWVPSANEPGIIVLLASSDRSLEPSFQTGVPGVVLDPDKIQVRVTVDPLTTVSVLVDTAMLTKSTVKASAVVEPSLKVNVQV